jgi:hypothetical protein
LNDATTFVEEHWKTLNDADDDGECRSGVDRVERHEADRARTTPNPSTSTADVSATTAEPEKPETLR